jgi:hypothetical protein
MIETLGINLLSKSCTLVVIHACHWVRRMDSEKRRPSCTDQFVEPPEPKPGWDRWLDSFMKRLLELFGRTADKK